MKSPFPKPASLAGFVRAAVVFALMGATLPAFAAQAETPPLSVSFDAAPSGRNWTLADLARAGIKLPSDWSGYNYLVLEMKASSPDEFFLKIQDGARWLRLSVYPMQGALVRACLPLEYLRFPNRKGYDMASVGNRATKTLLLRGMGGAHGDLDHVMALGVEMEAPIGTPTLEIRDIRLAKESPGEKLISPVPVVDEFGQWIPADWPGKARSLEQLRADWSAEEKSLPVSAEEGHRRFGYGKFGGYEGLSRRRATGFFRTEKTDGRWWLVDPEGLPFFSVGANGMSPWMGTPVHEAEWHGRRVEGREELFAALPPETVAHPAWTSGSALIQAQVSFFAWNIHRRFADAPGWEDKWRDLTLRRMAGWGLNTVSNWSEPGLYEEGRAPYVYTVYDLGIKEGILGMPDVYSEEWLKTVDAAAARWCEPRRDDPWLIGYFLGNEPPWAGRETVVVNELLDGPDTATQRHLKEWLAEGDTRERRVAWVYDAYRKFLDGAIAAVRRHDPNHLILGMRYATNPSRGLLKASSGFDVVSINSYKREPQSDALAFISRELDKPVLIGEFHFCVPDRGMAGGLVPVRDQQARAVAYQYYLEHAAANPAVVGAHWFQWMDQPSTGRNDGERYATGLVDVTDRPYPELIEALRRTHARLRDIHAGTLPPVTEQAARR